MPDTSSKTDPRGPMQSLLSLIGRSDAAKDMPEKLVFRMKRMERDLSRRLPDRGFLKP